jgi:hypothetical protein
MIVYIAGPMRSRPLYNFNAFFAAAMDLREQGFEVLNPAERDMSVGFDPSRHLEDQANGFSLHEAFDWDVKAVARADAIVLLPGWNTSKGAQTELVVALSLGKQVYEYYERGLVALHLSGYTVEFQHASDHEEDEDAA